MQSSPLFQNVSCKDSDSGVQSNEEQCIKFRYLIPPLCGSLKSKPWLAGDDVSSAESERVERMAGREMPSQIFFLRLLGAFGERSVGTVIFISRGLQTH